MSGKRYEKLHRWLLGLAEAQVTASGSRATFVSDMYFDAAEAINTLEAENVALVKSIQALGAMPEGYCFCFGNERDPNKPEHEHTGECRDLRSALKAVQGGDGNG